MLLTSTQNLHYPITVTELLKSRNETVTKSEALFSYFYKSLVTEGNRYGDAPESVLRTFPTRFESEIDGTVVSWKIAKGTVIDRPGVPLLEIDEPCRHDVQFGGMCANCGKDMTEVDYNTSNPNSARALINMTHGNTALKVSRAEAASVEEAVKRRLLSAKKLSLVVDLDQTIIHATVDPTVAEWQNDPSNPNYEAVKDVRSFQLLDDGPGRGCWYYIKLRPGLFEFLDRVSKLYELHIYTMGTRAYALNIAKTVDPDGRIFGERILSRDESGSLTVKNLQRLFPVDTKMVVIIDDRGDVWQWSDNLIKVTPYDFFVGIGDINSTFLPRREEVARDDDMAIDPSPPPNPSIDQADGAAVNKPEPKPDSVDTSDLESVSTSALLSSTTPSATSPSAASTATSASINGNPAADAPTLEHHLASMSGVSDQASLQKKVAQQDEALAAQVEDRPLLQKQRILDLADEEANAHAAFELNGHSETADGTQLDDSGSDALSNTSSQQRRHNLLQDNDVELIYLEKNLRLIHTTFYDLYLRNKIGAQGGRVAELRGERSPRKRGDDDLGIVPDIKEIMPPMKTQVLMGLTLTFSGVIPLGIPVASSDLARWALSFGAKLRTEVSAGVTHVIAARNRRTAKVRQAARNPNIKIVTTNWLFDCFTRWTHLDETPYIIEVEPDKDGAGARATELSPFDQLLEGALSSSEVEDNNDEDDDSEPETNDNNRDGSVNRRAVKPSAANGRLPALSVKTDGGGRATGAGAGDEDDGSEAPGDDEDDEDAQMSPIGNVSDADWEAMRAEIEEEMGDDVDESEDTRDYEDEDEDEDEQGSVASSVGSDGESSQQSAPRSLKRKRVLSSSNSVADEQTLSTDPAVAVEGAVAAKEPAAAAEPGSRLQERKRRALERTSSLTKMSAVVTGPNPPGSSPSAPEAQPPIVANGSSHAADAANGGDDTKGAGEDEEQDSDRGESEADLEKELEAELEGMSEDDAEDDLFRDPDL